MNIFKCLGWACGAFSKTEVIFFQVYTFPLILEQGVTMYTGLLLSAWIFIRMPVINKLRVINFRLLKLLYMCARSVASVISDSLQLYGLKPSRLLCPWDSPGKKTGVGCHVLLQGIFPTQESNAHLMLLHWQSGSLLLVPLGEAPFLTYMIQNLRTFLKYFLPWIRKNAI